VAKVTVLQRRHTVQLLEAGQPATVVEVTFMSDAVGPRSLTLPLGSYRNATPEERAANPRYHVLPVDQAAVDAEKTAIQEEIQRAAVAPAETFELP
jgi:hypothetical protein